MPDLDATVMRLRALDGDVWGEPHTTELANGTTVRLVMTCDPDGSVIELREGDGPRVSFVAVCCADLERTVACYRALGLREATRFTIAHDDGARLRLRRPGNDARGRVHCARRRRGPRDRSRFRGAAGETVTAASSQCPRSRPHGVPRHRSRRRDRRASSRSRRRARLRTGDDGNGSRPSRLALRVSRGPDGEVVEYIEQPN